MRYSVCVACLLAAAPASAVTYRYTGAEPAINNISGIALNTGVLSIDTAKTGSLANARLTYPPWSAEFPPPPPRPEGVDITFTVFEADRDEWSDQLSFDLHFDGDANLQSWRIVGFNPQPFAHGGYTFLTSSDPFEPHGPSLPVPFFEASFFWDLDGPSAIRFLSTSPGTWVKEDDTTPVPLPAGLPFMLGGLALLAFLRRRLTHAGT